jgi:hypothetical protein
MFDGPKNCYWIISEERNIAEFLPPDDPLQSSLIGLAR